MAEQVYLVVLRIIVSVVGIIGNVVLIQSIMKQARFKTFEIFLLGLAFSNVEEIVIVDIYDIVVFQTTGIRISVWWCRVLKFLTVLGEIGSIAFTVLISVYRYQKLRDAEKRVSQPILMDGTRAAYGFCGGSFLFALGLAVPTYVTNLDGHMSNLTGHASCPPDFFQCPEGNCPLFNKLYKYTFITLCNLLPLLTVSWTSCLIVRVLIHQQRAIHARQAAQPQVQSKARRSFRFRQSTVAILVAMAVFQVDWTLYLALHLASSPYTFAAWSEVEFFITTAYTTISPYVYGIGNNLFSLKNLRCDS